MADKTMDAALGRNLIERVCVGDITTRGAALFPHKAALIDGERRLTYRQLDEQANRLGRALLGLGLNHQDAVGVMAGNCLELLVTYFACAKAGLVCAPINLGLRGEEIAYCLKDAAARVLVVQGELVELARDLPAALPDLEAVYWTGDAAPTGLDKDAGSLDALIERGSPQELEVLVRDRDAVQLLYTSGTTALPKGVLTSHLAVTFAGLTAALGANFGADSRYLLVLPLFHCAMLNSAALPCMTVGATLVMTGTFEPRRHLQLIEQHQATTVMLLPMMFAQLLSDPERDQYDLSSVENAIYAMAPMPDERLQAIHDLFPNADVILGSGQTEYTPVSCMQRPEHQWSKAASWGTASAMTRVAIMDDAGNLLPRGEVGEIVYRGPQVMNGYLNQPDKTAETEQYGWFHSGDIAWMDEDGGIWFTDRKKDIIKSGGENVASIEVERCLMGHPAVAEAAAVGLPHSHWGEAITAVVIPAAGQELDEATLLEHCRANLASFKVPKAIVFVEEFPRTGTGKVQKNVLRDQYQSQYQSA